MNKVKLLGILSLVSASGLTAWLVWVHVSFTNMEPIQKLQLLWNEDVELLLENNYLHKGFKNLKEVRFNATSETTEKWASKLKFPLRTHETGKYRVEVLLLSWINQNKMGAIIQYDLFDIDTNNLQWELGRTFTLDENYIAPKGQ